MLNLISFHTDDKLYSNHSRLLEFSAKKFNLNLQTTKVEASDWQKIIAYKSSFINDMRKEIEGKILYLDADAILHEDVTKYFLEINEDIGAHFFKGEELISSTIFINNTNSAKEIIEEWNNRMILSPNTWDQKVLQDLVLEWEKNGRITIKRLPENFTYIFDLSLEYYGSDVRPIIEHFQASRDTIWIKKYKESNLIKRFFLRIPFFSGKLRTVIKRHHIVNEKSALIGCDVIFRYDELI